MSVELRIEGLGALRARLHGVLGRLGRLASLQAAAGRSVADWVRRNVDAQGRLGGARWPRLEPRTLAARRRAGLGTQPLVATGRLRAGTRLRLGPQGAVVENPVPYAAVHQLGLGVPARPFFPAAARARRIVDPVLERFVREALR